MRGAPPSSSATGRWPKVVGHLTGGAGASFRRLWLDRVRRILEASDRVVEVTSLGVRQGERR